MNWIVLILSLGAIIMSVILGAAAILTPAGGDGSPFTMTIGILVLLSAALAAVGGSMAFARRRFGGFLLLISAAICFFAHPNTRIYAYFYIIAGILAFFCRRKEDVYEYYDDDDEDDEPEWQKEARDDEDIPRAPSVRSRERVRTRESRLTPSREEHVSVRRSGRSVKTCPRCMTEVDISYKFCHECGHRLSTSERIPSERIPSDVAEPENTTQITPPVSLEKEKSPFALFPEREAEAELETESGREYNSEYGAPESENENEEYESSDGDSSDTDADDDLQDVRTPGAHKVFVKPEPDGRSIPKMPINIGPDNSYQAFHNYTRRRRNKRHSLLRRSAAIFVLLAAAGGTAWFLLGLNKTPPKDLSVSIPPERPAVVLDPEPSRTDSSDADSGLAVPGDSVRGDIFSSLRIDSPSRGVVIGNGVNIRGDHSTSGSVVTKMNRGARTDVLDSWRDTSGAQAGVWYQIRTPSGNGWIRGDYIQPLDSRATTLPVGYTSALLKTLGSNKTELMARLGAITRQTPTTLTWQGISVNIRGDSDITRIQLTSALHVLQNGVAVGITEDRLYQSVGYPSEYRDGRLLYLESPTQGISVQMKNGKVEQVTVGNV